MRCYRPSCPASHSIFIFFFYFLNEWVRICSHCFYMIPAKGFKHSFWVKCIWHISLSNHITSFQCQIIIRCSMWMFKYRTLKSICSGWLYKKSDINNWIYTLKLFYCSLSRLLIHQNMNVIIMIKELNVMKSILLYSSTVYVGLVRRSILDAKSAYWFILCIKF